MIKLNSSKNEKEHILNLIKKSISDRNIELECILMNDISKNQNISYQQFIDIIKRVKNKKKFLEQKEQTSLDIYFPIDSKFHNIRCIIKGYGSISNYCNHEDISSILNNVIFQKKRIDKIENKLNIPNYNIKFNLKKENYLDKDDAIIRDLIKNWKKELKTYRYKKRYSFEAIDNEFKIDLSIIKTSAKSLQYLTINEIYQRNLFTNVSKPHDVKTSFSNWWNTVSKNKNEKVQVKDVPTFFKNIAESYVFNNIAEYEAEIEYIGNKKKINLDNTKVIKNKIDSIFNTYFSYIGILIQAIQNSFFIISNQEKIDLEKNIQRMIDKSIKQNNKEFKQNQKDQNSSKENDEQSNNSDMNHSKAFIKGNYRLNPNKIFFGPLAVDLDYQNIAPIYQSELSEDFINTNSNIRLNYLVTDKADGERNLLIINDKGVCYGINRANAIKLLGITIPKFANSIFDIEFINKTQKGKICNNIYIFDCYINSGLYMMNKPFLWNKEGGRHKAMKDLEKYLENSSEVINDNEKLPTRIYIKNYYPSDNPKTLNKKDIPQIFTSCKQILSKMNVKYGGFIEDGHEFTYATDGLIFIPNNLGIYQEHVNDKIYNPFISKSWYMNYKWKNNNDLTIDFKIEFLKNLSNKSINYIYFENKKYVQVNLCSKVYQNSLPNQLNYTLLNDGLKSQNIPNDYLFQPTYPFYGYIDEDNQIINTSYMCYLEVDNNNNIYCENKDIIVDGSMVEFRYDLNKDEKFRWQPIRLRSSYNSFNISSDIWRLIHNPISKDLITNNPSDIENNKLLPYYKYNNHLKYISQPLKEFNNYVKDYLIERSLSQVHKPFVLDLACGKMGDYFKYVKYGVFFLLGIDINPDNIHNKNDGAASRIMNNIDKNAGISKLASKTILVNGDVTKNIQSGEAAIDQLNEHYLNIVYGKTKSKIYKHNRLFNYASEGFHLVTCMYSIHYMMDSEDSLSSFLLNVSENLRDQGYFIGTCLDSSLLLEMFKGTNQVIGEVNNNLIYKIEKIEDEDYSNITVGNKINIYYETFNTMMSENLVDIKYLEEKANEYNLKLIESNTYLEEPGNLLSSYNNKSSKNVEIINKNKDLTAWANINRYFIFQKSDRLNEE